ncbi:hypothetical protein OCH239_19040 [Roseivivax halodurans JCM 10272]|uniref:Uncharacterized protein n=1 Tax=Roseivivax halodurans JCM 10272 TaxID=1449350 RepID=X7E957_9RHOB|nr:hypothetical protein OCH239_19040 [Roseivivax halodurans JCM 10272]
MSMDVFIIGLGALSMIAVLIYAVTGRTERDHHMQVHNDRPTSSLARDGRSH